MIVLYKDLSKTYNILRVVTVITIVGLVVALVINRNSLYIPVFFGGIILMLVLSIIFNRLAANRNKHIISQIMDGYPDQAIDYINQYLETVTDETGKNLLNTFLAEAYYYHGDFLKCVQLLEEVDEYSKTAPINLSFIMKSTAYSFSMYTLYHMGRMSEAEAMKKKYLDTFEEDETTKNFDIIKNIPDASDDKLQEYIKHFSKDFKDSKSLLVSKVSSQYYMAKIYDRLGDSKNAEKCRTYIKENGRNTFFVRWV